MTIGEKIKLARSLVGMTSKELAFLSDTPKFQINLKILFLIFIIIVLICIIVIFIANQLHPPIYYYRIK